MKKRIGFAIMLAALLAAFTAVALAEESSPLDRFTPEQKVQLEKGEAVYQHIETKDEAGNLHGHGESYIIINAPVDECFNIFTRFNEQQLYFPRKKVSEVVEHEGNKYLVHKVFEFYVVDVEYYVLYTVDSEKHRVDFEMDKNRPHDIDDTAGYFLFEKLDDNHTLFTYAATKVETGVSVPGFIKDYITSKDLPAVVESAKKRIESGGKWTKDS